MDESKEVRDVNQSAKVPTEKSGSRIQDLIDTGRRIRCGEEN